MVDSVSDGACVLDGVAVGLIEDSLVDDTDRNSLTLMVGVL